MVDSDGLLAAVQGDRLPALRALRDALATRLDACESDRDWASLSLRLVDVLAQIDEITGGARVPSVADEIARRRAERKASAT